ncbi:MAG: hypothetical protein UH081_08400 [Clostridia bacterium]|nr:hypothetical protein [Clostridia bacterium]
MKNISIDFTQNCGIVKPMHAVNNGPSHKFAVDQRISNLEAYREAGIPYARNHDAAFWSTYGGEHTVDISAIFPDFDKDPYDPESYDFVLTDEYLQVIQAAGAECFYRLGAKIEHNKKKYGTLPPKDFKKWAVICEHIIRHYNYGWADGFEMNIKYWEIWNEPDLDDDDSAHKRCWGGTKKQFFEFYNIAAAHLKKCFPELKIGGPALAHNLEWGKEFLAQLEFEPDFFSWHIYSSEPKKIIDRANIIKGLLEENGFTKTESILNEWNYVRGWTGDEWIYSLETEKNLKGSSFVAGTMCLSQYSSIDMLMYYDARPCGMNGMFDMRLISRCLKGYYPFKMFNTLYKMGNCAPVECEENLYACAAMDGDKAAVMFTHYNDDENTPETEVKLNINGFNSADGVRAKYYILDEAHDMSLIREETFCGNSFATVLNAPLYGTYLVTFEKI